MFLTDFKKKEILSSRCLYVCMLYILCLSANFSVTTEPILGKLIVFSLALINLGRGERMIKIGQVVLMLHQKIKNLFHYYTLYARTVKGRSIRRLKNRARQNINASSVPYRFLLAFNLSDSLSFHLDLAIGTNGPNTIARNRVTYTL